MLRHQGGDHVRAGFYFNLDSWEINTLSGTEGGALEGGEATRYLRIPVTAMLLFAPLMGALFAVFLPFIGIYLVGQYCAGKAWAGLRHATHAMVLALGPSWQPAAAHLTGDQEAEPKKAAEGVDAGADQKLDALEKEIEQRQPPATGR